MLNVIKIVYQALEARNTLKKWSISTHNVRNYQQFFIHLHINDIALIIFFVASITWQRLCENCKHCEIVPSLVQIMAFRLLALRDKGRNPLVLRRLIEAQRCLWVSCRRTPSFVHKMSLTYNTTSHKPVHNALRCCVTGSGNQGMSFQFPLNDILRWECRASIIKLDGNGEFRPGD